MVADGTPHVVRNQLAAAVGHALSEWAEVEIVMAFVLIAAFDTGTKPHVEGLVPWNELPEDQRMLHSALGKVVAFEARVDIISAVIDESSLSPWIKKLWLGVSERLMKKYKSRHQIAHFVISHQETEDGGIRIFIAPFPNSSVSFSDRQLSLSDVETKLHNFRELKEALQWLGWAIEIDRQRREEPLPQPPPLIQRVLQSVTGQSR
jgi:hypothetical protein